MFYKYYDGDRGAHDHYILGIEMDSCTLVEEPEGPYEYCCEGEVTLNWTHYTEPIKPRGKNLQVDFQQLKCTCIHQGTITIKEKTEE